MTLQRPMFPEKLCTLGNSFSAPVVLDPTAVASPAPKPATIGRRGLLGAFLALVPTAAAASASTTVTAPGAPPAPRERASPSRLIGEASDPVFAAIEAYRHAEKVFHQVTTDAEAALVDGVLTNVERWDAQDRCYDEIFWPRLVDLISTPPATLVGLSALLAFVRQSGGLLELIGDHEAEMSTFERSVESSVCALAHLPAPPLSMHLQDRDGGDHAAA